MKFLPTVFLAALALGGCSAAVTPNKMSRIKAQMKPDEVTTLLGQPTHIEHAETTGLTGDVYHYTAQHGEGRVVFVNDAVFSAQFVPEAPP